MEWEFFYDDGHEYLQDGLPYYEEVLSSPPTTPRKMKGASTEEGSLQDVTSPSSTEDFHDLVSLEMEIMKKVATRLQDFESQITAQLSHVTTDFDKKLSDVHRSSATSIDGLGPYSGLDTMAEDVDQLKFDVGELKDLLTNNKGEVNHIPGSVLACERDMEDFTATMTAEISRMRLDIGDIQEALKNHDSGMEDVSNTLQQMQEKEDNITQDLINLKKEFITKLDGKVDNVAWKEANDDLDAAIKTVHDMISSLRLDVDARHGKVDEILSTMRHDITSVETNLEESKAKFAMDIDHAINALNGRIDFTNKDLSATRESLHTTRNSLSDCFNEAQTKFIEFSKATMTQFQDIAAAIEQRAEVGVSESEFLLRGSAPATQSIDWEAEQNWDQGSLPGSLSDLEEATDVWRGDQTAPNHQENFFY